METTDAFPVSKGVVSRGALSVLTSVSPYRLGKKRDSSALNSRGGAIKDLPLWNWRLPQSRKYGLDILAVLGKSCQYFSATAEDVSVEGVAVYSSFRLAMCFS